MVGIGTRNGVIALSAPGMTPAEPMDGQPRAFDRAVTVKRFQCIGGTGGLKAAAMPDSGAQDQPISAHGQGNQMRERRHALGL